MNETLSRTTALAAVIAKTADETERARQVPAALIDQLAAAGCLRMMVPVRHGGDGLPLPDALRVLEELARADGSTGWLVGQITLAQLVFACFPERAQQEVYAGGPDVLGAGAVAPKGRASATGDGWKVTGQWPYVTGCPQASWVYLNCVVLDGRTPRVLPDGTPQTRIVLVPAADLTIQDTWHVLGLRGTASHDVRAGALDCPGWRSFSLRGDEPGDRRAIFSIAQAGLLIAAVGLGIAQGALDEIAQLAADGRRRAFSRTPLGASQVFQDRLGDAYVTLRAARALLHQEAATAWAIVSAGRAAEPLDRACLRAAAARVTGFATAAVDTAHALAGGASAYESSPLQRRLRDIHTATQHFVNGRDFYATVGALLAGEQVDPNTF
ncbi:acyl-CoA dehydrogenase family protein [Planotetraspora sp. A-T 1434]|uniref:acyl-CoA dehydrogenase family protein n=1 Tax=Planotetraspora sp. A-T 1434 TaxID=2979219 RepID=UPI0021BEF4B2|nr:acyl-CoA dehydrogenase family protein [Planotetraspora sp. A-T 1434]MCT9933158.1 acyl-CoA dehydrogenase family protein [Planotetraspora sp. A-T 1434]